MKSETFSAMFESETQFSDEASKCSSSEHSEKKGRNAFSAREDDFRDTFETMKFAKSTNDEPDFCPRALK